MISTDSQNSAMKQIERISQTLDMFKQPSIVKLKDEKYAADDMEIRRPTFMITLNATKKLGDSVNQTRIKTRMKIKKIEEIE